MWILLEHSQRICYSPPRVNLEGVAGMMGEGAIIVGNWKMHKISTQALEFVEKLIAAIDRIPREVYLAVPYTMIQQLAERCRGSRVIIGAQNMNDASEGAFTGEIAGQMLKDAGAAFVILGHSERRRIFSESSSFINKKVKRALSDGIRPILCVGETLQEREKNLTESVLESQLNESLEGVSDEELEGMILAYEPVWAIGTGRTATPEQAEEMHCTCQEILKRSREAASVEKLPILYGGSVSPGNVRPLMDRPHVDGVLVGGASLLLDSFFKIINYDAASAILGGE